MPAGSRFNPLRPVYTCVGDEFFHCDRFRRELVALLPEADRELGLFDLDLASTPLDEILDQARSPSLLAPLQLFFVRNARELFGRGASSSEDDPPAAGKKGAVKKSKKKHGDFPANLERFARAADAAGSAPASVVVFIADHLHLPADPRRLGLEDKSRLQRIEATLGACGELVMCARATETEAAAIARDLARERGAELDPETARRLAEILDGSLGQIRAEIEKLALYALPGRQITPDAVAALVTGAQTGSAYELAQALAPAHPNPRARALGCLRRVWSEAGDAGAIGLVFQLSRAFSMALIARQQRVRDRSALYQALPEGLRPPSFAADTVLAIARAMPEPQLRRALRLLHAADIELRSNTPSPRLVFERLICSLTPSGTTAA